MRWTEKKSPALYDRRIRTFFAWFPERIPWDTDKEGYKVWLERVTVEEKLYPSGTWRITSERPSHPRSDT